MFDLVPHGADTYVGAGPRYPWGGLYGGQIVAQALRAASATVDEDKVVHSLRAYFIRRGDHTEPVRYEVDRIRNGRSFVTRRVVARQAIGAILNLEASYQRAEESATVLPMTMPVVPAADGAGGVVVVDGLRPALRARGGDPAVADRRRADGGVDARHDAARRGRPAAPLLAGLPVRRPALRRRHPGPSRPGDDRRRPRTASSPASTTACGSTPSPRVDEWHLYDVTCLAYAGGRGLTLGQVFGADGTHVATFAQEALVRST